VLKGKSGPRIGIDVDGVLRDIDQPLLEVMKKYFPQFKLINPGAWQIAEKFSDLPENFSKILFTKYAKQIFLDGLVYPGAHKFYDNVLKLAEKYNGDVAIVTKQNVKSSLYTLKWLARHKFHVESLFIIYEPQSKTKAECDILVDDNLENLTEQEALYGGAICVKHPWNSGWPKKRLNDYDEILKIIEQLLERRKKLHEEFKRLTKPEQLAAMQQAFIMHKGDK
jgi:5'(3')-deoxyribonucleotidase